MAVPQKKRDKNMTLESLLFSEFESEKKNCLRKLVTRNDECCKVPDVSITRKLVLCALAHTQSFQRCIVWNVFLQCQFTFGCWSCTTAESLVPYWKKIVIWDRTVLVNTLIIDWKNVILLFNIIHYASKWNNLLILRTQSRFSLWFSASSK